MGVRSSRPAQFDPTFKATTDQDGNYRVGDVPTGSYEVASVAPAFVISEVNNSRGQTLIIIEGEHVEGIDFDLVRGGVITGKVTDADGSPVVAERVNLLPVDQRNQRGPVYAVSSGFQTDDRGIYRMFGIRPGSYKVSIGQGDTTFYGVSGTGRPAYRATFYPDATDPAKATIVEIDEGTETNKIDITLGPTVPGFSVSGRVVDESGKPVSNVSIGLSRIIMIDANNSSRSGGGTGARSDSQGEFRVENLPPGKYSISSYPPPESDLRTGPVAFEILDQDVTGLLIKSSIGASLSGMVVLEGSKDNSAAARLARLHITASVYGDGNPGFGRTSQINPNGSFRFGGFPAGTVNFSLGGDLLRGFAISRLERDGVVQQNGIQIQNVEQVTGIRVVVAYYNGAIRGVVKLENGTWPSSGRLLIQLTKSGDQSGNIQPSDADSRGHFLIEGLAAGDYELRVIAYVPGSSQRPPTTKQIVTVTDGAATNVTVTIDLTTPGP